MKFGEVGNCVIFMNFVALSINNDQTYYTPFRPASTQLYEVNIKVDAENLCSQNLNNPQVSHIRAPNEYISYSLFRNVLFPTKTSSSYVAESDIV